MDNNQNNQGMQGQGGNAQQNQQNLNDSNGGAAGAQNNSSGSGEKMFTQEELNKIIEREKLKAKDAARKEIEEANKLAKMGEDERHKYELKKITDERDALLKEKNRSEMQSIARGILKEKGIADVDDNILASLVSDTADVTTKNINSFADSYKAAVQKEVIHQLGGKTPKTGARSNLTKQDILNVKDRAERQKLISENLELFK